LPVEDGLERSGIFLKRANASFRQSPVASASSPGRLSAANAGLTVEEDSGAGLTSPDREVTAPDRGSKNELAP
jgi:hypothetical protein